MVSRRRAFACQTGGETMAAILCSKPTKLTASSQAIPPELEGVNKQCLKKKPEERYQSVRDLARDLEALLSGAVINTPAQVRSSKRMSPAHWVAAIVDGDFVILLAMYVHEDGACAERFAPLPHTSAVCRGWRRGRRCPRPLQDDPARRFN